LLPAAKIFGLVMENLTMRMNPHIGRFIRVLAGNIVELISGVSRLLGGMSRVLTTHRLSP
jgi:Ca2+/H+ antiporter